MQSVIERPTLGERLYYEALGANIREQRMRRGWSQLDLAIELGFESGPTVHYWETAKHHPSVYMVARMEELFNEQVRP